MTFIIFINNAIKRICFGDYSGVRLIAIFLHLFLILFVWTQS